MASVGIINTKLLLEELQGIALDIVDIVKNGKNIFKIFSIINHVLDLIRAAPSVLPELADLNAEESAELGSAGYAFFKSVIDEIKK